VQEALARGKRRLLTERQKLIKIADHSEHGWGVVAEYTANELAVGEVQTVRTTTKRY